MSLKIRARKMGRKIRQITGLPLPIAMRAAHLVVRCRGEEMVSHPLFAGLVKQEMFPCGAECCGSRGLVLRGPKGGFSIWGLAEA